MRLFYILLSLIIINSLTVRPSAVWANDANSTYQRSSRGLRAELPTKDLSEPHIYGTASQARDQAPTKDLSEPHIYVAAGQAKPKTGGNPSYEHDFAKPRIINGELNLTYRQAQTPFSLEGNWLIEYSALTEFEYETTTFIKVPKAIKLSPSAKNCYGYASYILNINTDGLINTLAISMPIVSNSYRIFWNGNESGSAGLPHISKELYKPGWHPQIILLENVRLSNRLIIQVANFDDITSGLSIAPKIGLQENMYNKRLTDVFLEIVVFGSLLFMAFYHFGLYFYRQKDKSPLYFGILSLILGLRAMLYGEVILLDIAPISYNLLIKSGYLTFSIGVASFISFLHSLYPSKQLSIVNRFAFIVSAIYSVMIIVSPLRIFSSALIYYQLISIAVGFYSIYLIIISFIKKEEGSLFFLIGLFIFFITALLDILSSMLNMHSIQIVSLGILVFMFIQSIIITKKFSLAFEASEKLRESLAILNNSLERFIPREVLSFLQKKSIVDIRLGDHVEKEMTVFFIDIRNFTAMSERMTPEENFKFINSYLNRVGPVIRSNQGFVDKYIGDGIMALFPVEADFAVRAAVEIRKALIDYNQQRASAGYEPIQVGMGIHTGKLMLGTIGENMRMDSTVISDTVNVASRLEALTKKINCDILISKTTWEQLSENFSYSIRPCGCEEVKGKKEPIEVFVVE